MSLETKCPHCGTTYEVAACEVNSTCKCQICSKSFVVKIVPKSKTHHNVRRAFALACCLTILIITSFGAYGIFQVVNKAIKNKQNETEATYSVKTAIQHQEATDIQDSRTTGTPIDTKLAVPVGDQEWPRCSNSDKAIYMQDTNDVSSLVVAQYWAADYLDRVQYTCFADELRKTDAFREYYQQAIAKGQNNPWNDQVTLVKISKSAPITWLKSVDSSVWRIVEVEQGTITNTYSTCYIVNASATPPKILWSPNKLRIKGRSDVYKIFEATKDPLFGELLYLHYYGKCKSEFPSLPLLDYQVSDQIIGSFPEKLRGSYGILWGEFMGHNDNQDKLPGITVESNGLISLVRVSEKEKHLGFNLQLYARVGKKVESSFFRYCFTRKAPSSFEKWMSIERGTYLFVLGRFITLERTGGALGFYATQVMTYNLAEDKWICLTE